MIELHGHGSALLPIGATPPSHARRPHKPTPSVYRRSLAPANLTAPPSPSAASRIHIHGLRHSAVALVAIKELLGHARIGVTAGVYAHVRLRLQRDAIDTLSTALSSGGITETASSDGDEPPPCTILVR
ncbi:hypothetical protein GCM10009549_48840 [Streptomyces thermoalcalitolerans]|uniref:Tyr recombinase domain-containing protein n=1 Tax=Streptomyces thermoalcalitolerans TaxID=65605 RepID=A0ABP3ZY94_9ACTN